MRDSEYILHFFVWQMVEDSRHYVTVYAAKEY